MSHLETIGRANRSSQGVSLVEALVALAVMAFGILGVVGVQTTLRGNGDIAKQRAEAVRIAQEQVENARAFTVLALPPAPTTHTNAYDQLVTSGPTTVAGSNTSFTVTRTVNTVSTRPGKTLRVDVGWTDRNGTAQTVSLTTLIAGILPELSGSASIMSRGLSNLQVQGRNLAVPANATDMQNGTSNFSPTGVTGGVTWVFNNITGLITSICNPYPTTCTTGTTWAMLSGFVNFALGASQPQPQDAEFPTSAPVGGVQVLVNVTAPTVSTVTCLQRTSASNIEYFCAIPLPSAPPLVWSGRALLDSTTLAISTTAGTSASQFRVCRYTPDPTTDTANNIDHPLDYSAVNTSLANQNFLVIRGGNGTTAFSCPLDDASTTFVDGDTREHQPPH